MAESQTDQFVQAARDGDFQLVQRFLRNAADLNLQDSKGDTALCQASAGGHTSLCFKLLIEHKADPNAKDSQGNAAIHYATACGHDQIVELLVRSGANLEVVDKNGWCPLHYAAQSGRLDSVTRLLKKGTPLHAQTPDGSTAAHIALMSQKFSLDVLKELCGWPGAKQEMKNNAKESVLDVARKTGNTPAIEYLSTIDSKSPSTDSDLPHFSRVRGLDVLQSKHWQLAKPGKTSRKCFKEQSIKAQTQLHDCHHRYI